MRAGAPIVPVAIRGAREIMPRGSLVLHPGPVSVEIGAPIPTAGVDAADRERLLAEVRRQIAEMSGQELAPPAEASGFRLQA
jgi:1-acyl-sn-glycerol-3-phosphate acyltransferase